MRVSVRNASPADLDHELLWTAVGAGAAALAWALTRHPLPAPIGRCLFKAVTGWPCVTCGGTRAMHALFEGQVADAVRANPLVVLGVAGWTGYAAYASGAMAGAWHRVRIQLDHGAASAARGAAVLVVVVTWIYLIAVAR